MVKDWSTVAAIDRFVTRNKQFTSMTSVTCLLLVVAVANEQNDEDEDNTSIANKQSQSQQSQSQSQPEVMKDVWLERRNERDAANTIFAKLLDVGAWPVVSQFLFQAELPQVEMSVYMLKFTECQSNARLVSRQTTKWLETGELCIDLRALSDHDSIMFTNKHPHIEVGHVVRVKLSKARATHGLFRVRSLRPLTMQHEPGGLIAFAFTSSEEDGVGGIAGILRIEGPTAIIHPDIASLTSVSREAAFATRSHILHQQRGILRAIPRDRRPLSICFSIIKRLTKTTMRCNFEELQKLQESYHFTPKNVRMLASMLRPPANEDNTRPGFYYAGCGLGREVVAMSMADPRQRFFANDLPGDDNDSHRQSAVIQAEALRALAIGFGLVEAAQLCISAASMCSPYSATKQTHTTGVLYSTVTSLDIFRSTLQRSLMDGVQIVCMLTHVARPNSTVAGSTFDGAVTSSVQSALGPHAIRSVRKTVATNIRGGGVIVYDFSHLSPCQRRTVSSSILAHAW